MPGVPAAFDEVIRHALEKRPDARLSSAGELGAAALTAAGHPTVARTKRTVPAAGVHRAPPSATWPDRPRARPAPRALAAVAATAAFAGALAAFLLTHDSGNAARPTSAPPSTTTIAAAAGKPPGGKEHVIPAPHVVRAVHVGTRPVNVEVAAGSAWVASTGHRRSTASRSAVTVATVGHTSASASRTSPTGGESCG